MRANRRKDNWPSHTPGASEDSPPNSLTSSNAIWRSFYPRELECERKAAFLPASPGLVIHGPATPSRAAEISGSYRWPFSEARRHSPRVGRCECRQSRLPPTLCTTRCSGTSATSTLLGVLELSTLDTRRLLLILPELLSSWPRERTFSI